MSAQSESTATSTATQTSANNSNSIASTPSIAPSPSSSPSLSNNKLHAALFDIDGTLADTDYFHRQVFKDLLGPYGFQVDDAFFDAHISGRSNKILAKQLFPDMAEEESDALFVHKETLFREKAEKEIKPLPGLIELLHTLRAKGVKTAAVTNAPKPNAEMLLRVMGLNPLFDIVVLGEDCAEPKPSPSPYFEAMRRLGTLELARVEHHLPSSSQAGAAEGGGDSAAIRSAHHQLLHPAGKYCVVFEDSPTGVAAGVASGSITVGIMTSQTHEALTTAGAHFTVHDYTQIDAEKLVLEIDKFVKSKPASSSKHAH